MSDETNAATARGGDFNLTPRGELRVSFAIAYAVTIGIVWLIVTTATNFPQEPVVREGAVAAMFAGWNDYWYRVGVVFWWFALIVMSLCALMFGGMIVLMHRSQAFREATVPRAALLRRDGGGS